MDSMLGYRSKPVGTPAARLDDLVMWLPARVSGLLLAIVAMKPRSLARTRKWLETVPSPNSGWPMGTVAATLDVRLEKPGVYVLNPDATVPDRADAERGIRTVAVAGVTAYLIAIIGLLVVEVVVWL
jgi:adenosylcobinamide-phosphate synthase